MTHTHSNIALVEVPEGCFGRPRVTTSFDTLVMWGHASDLEVQMLIGTWRYICLSTEMTEEKAREVVERYEQPIGWRADGDESKLSVVTLYRNYLIEKPIPVTFLKATALESFQTFVEFLGLADKEPLAVLVK